MRAAGGRAGEAGGRVGSEGSEDERSGLIREHDGRGYSNRASGESGRGLPVGAHLGGAAVFLPGAQTASADHPSA